MKIEVNDEDLEGLNLTPDRLRLEMAIGLYASEAVTLGKAASIAGYSHSAFLQELGRRRIGIHYDVKEFEQDLETLREISPL